MTIAVALAVGVAAGLLVRLLHLLWGFGRSIVILLTRCAHGRQCAERQNHRHQPCYQCSFNFSHNYLPPPRFFAISRFGGEAGSLRCFRFQQYGCQEQSFDAQTRLKVYYEFKVPTIAYLIAGSGICRPLLDFFEIQPSSADSAPYGARLSTKSDAEIANVIAVVERP